MGLAALMTAVVVLFILSGCLLYWFGNWFKHRLIVTVSVLISWYFSFMIVVVLPTDVSSTIYRQCLHEANSSVPWPAPLLQSNASSTMATSLFPSNVTSSLLPTLAPVNTTTETVLQDNSSVFETNSSFINNTSAPQPLDRYTCAEPWSFVPDNVLQSLWRVVYWTSQVLTWIIFPLMQSFSKAGDFTFWGKMKSALRDNGIYYASYLMLAGSFLVYLASIGTSLDWPKLKAIAATASNTWGLTLLILLLGYGLVEVPRTLWHMSRPGYVLGHDYFHAAKLAVEKTDAEEEVEDAVRILKAWSNQIQPGHPLYDHLVTIRAKLPEVYDTAFASGSQARISPSSGIDQPTEKSMTVLHKQLIKALQAMHRTRTQWRVLVDSINFDEDVAKNEASMDRYFKRTHSASPLPSTCWRRIFTPSVEWYWHCVFKRHLLRVLSVICAIWTVFVIWSEVTFFASNPTLSLFAVFLDLARSGRDYFSVELVSFFTIVYLCICTYFTIFKIRILNLYYLAPHHGTDEYSLLFSGMLLCRLTPPLCLNFLSLVHLDSHITKSENMLETSYTHIMGHMDVIDFISDYFNIYFPIGVVLLCGATWFSLGSRILSLLGFQQFMAEAEVTSELVQEGQELVRREKRKRRQPPGDANTNTGSAGLGARARGAANVVRSQLPSTGRLDRQGSSSRLQLIPNSESMDYTSFGDLGPSLNFGNDAEARRTQPPIATPPVTTKSSGLRRDIFDDV